jgi:heat-inducible transcriptional repressor
VVGPEAPLRLRHLHASPVNSHHILVVWVASDGRIEHRLIEAPTHVSAQQLERISEVLTNRLSGVEISAIPRVDLTHLLGQFPATLRVPLAVLQHIRDSIESQERGSVYVDGALYILRQPEFADVARARRVMEALSQAPVVRRMLLPALQQDDLTVTIGAETPVPQMRDCSVVGHRFRVGMTSGVLGVVGPTRMTYSETASIVSLVAERLSRTLARLGAF